MFVRTIAAALVLAAPAQAVVTATPATLAARLDAARPGDEIRLAAGAPGSEWPTIYVKDRRWASPGVTITADKGLRIAGVSVIGVEGLNWRGGTIRSPKPDGVAASGYAFHINSSQRIRLTGAQITDATTVRGIATGRNRHVEIRGNTIRDFLVDGIVIAPDSHDVTIADNIIESFNTGERHPDAIQSWSRAGRPVSDIIVTNNIIKGRAQGVYFGNVPARKPAGDPGFDRITITGNRVETLFPNGIVVADCRACTITGNRVASLPGARFRAKVLSVRGDGDTVCGNVVTALPDSAATARCNQKAPGQKE